MNNIYEGCINNKDVFYRDHSISWDEQLNNKQKYYENQGYKVVFVFVANSFIDAARVVLYSKDMSIPLCMQDYKHKYVKFNGHWILESLLGICDKCGNYTTLVSLSKKGHLCKRCSNEEDSNE